MWALIELYCPLFADDNCTNPDTLWNPYQSGVEKSKKLYLTESTDEVAKACSFKSGTIQPKMYTIEG